MASTHAPASWLESANAPDCPFSLANLPLAILRKVDEQGEFGVLATVVGDRAVDLTPLIEAGLFAECKHIEELEAAFEESSWTPPDGLSRDALREVRTVLQKFFADASPGTGASGKQTQRLREKCLSPLDTAEWYLPATMMNYTDFYASVHHATNVGSMFRPDNPLLPNYKHIPIGYHGRASSLVISGTPIARPSGQMQPDPQSPPVFGPCKRLDYELEMGCVIATGNEIGEPIGINDVEQHVLGLCIVNDWSARDMQAWEYQPLGPFLAKNFATSVSPFIVTLDALEPYRVAGPTRRPGDSTPLPYLTPEPALAAKAGFDIQLQVSIRTRKMAEANIPAHRISSGSFKDMFWTFGQMIAHHTSGGCNLIPGDLLASGTISGPEPESRGCLLELTWDGPPHNGPDGKPKPRKPITLPTGETRVFLEDGDEVIFDAVCSKPGLPPIGFGQCRGTIVG
jgi:fumarylacetoacetase